ncbi:MAG: CHASE domain-containing protein [Clostridiales bacterium]|nr:CHASE domain-containing protein [Clostridiales bacterium]
MFRIRKNKHFLVIGLFVLILMLFLVAAYFELERSIFEQKNEIFRDVQLITSDISGLINQSINHSDGIISYIQTNPELNQEQYSDYVSKVSSKSESIVRHHVAVKETTIVFSHPLEGNESAIGVDLSKIEGQKEEVLKVKNENISLLVGPVELVQGGRSLIIRMPIFIKENSEDKYWGQLSTVVNFENLLDQAGVFGFSEAHYIKIEYLDDIHDEKKLIFSNQDVFSDDKITSIIDVPHGTWEINIEAKEGYAILTPVFTSLLIIGVIISTIAAMILNYILKVNENLNEMVEIRTHDIKAVNQELEYSLKKLRQTQDQLIMREKHAAMGELVAGVAHEINTPLGVSVTANSYLSSISASLITKLENQKLKKSELDDGLKNIAESSHIVSFNLTRASELINSFKMLSSDQHYEEKKEINLKEYIDFIIRAVSPTYRGTTHTILCNIEEDIIFTTYPGELSQVITNLLMNSLVHGFENLENGKVIINGNMTESNIVIDYFDNGKGIPKDISDKIFNPFFTTKRNLGNTGLGLNIAFNIVTQQLNGTISLDYDIDVGVHFKILIPLEE